MNEAATFNLTDLAREADVTPRTVRYYIGQGLLPGPVGQGPAAHYDEGHLARLRIIRRLQLQHLPLAEIRARLAELDEEEIARLAVEVEAEPTPETQPGPGASALDYIRTVLGQGPATIRGVPPAPAPPAARAAAAAPSPARQQARLAPDDVAMLREPTSSYTRTPPLRH